VNHDFEFLRIAADIVERHGDINVFRQDYRYIRDKNSLLSSIKHCLTRQSLWAKFLILTIDKSWPKQYLTINRFDHIMST
jgi:hypothetical protein